MNVVISRGEAFACMRRCALAHWHLMRASEAESNARRREALVNAGLMAWAEASAWRDRLDLYRLKNVEVGGE